ncbi:MAG: hypothetical protein FWE36_05185 [Erysipelotrichales bacterium]|nr:hypothetical protein [Erysipelotrichales bacterium]
MSKKSSLTIQQEINSIRKALDLKLSEVERKRLKARLNYLYSLGNENEILFGNDNLVSKDRFSKKGRPYYIRHKKGDYVGVNKITHDDDPKYNIKLESIGEDSYLNRVTYFYDSQGRKISYKRLSENKKKMHLSNADKEKAKVFIDKSKKNRSNYRNWKK